MPVMRIPAPRLFQCRFWAVALACVASFAGSASAQIEQPTAFCWTGWPAPACRAFLVAEGNLYTAVAGSRYDRRGHDGRTTRSLELTGYAAWEVGGMVNVGPRTAWGTTVMLGGDANGVRMALKGRYRRWLSPATALDLGAGVLGAGRSVPHVDQPGNDHVAAVGLTADASLGLTDWVSLGGRADLLFSDAEDDPATAYYAGVRLGTRPALVATAAPLVFAAIAAVFAGSGGP
jgi:hypothetical protein